MPENVFRSMSHGGKPFTKDSLAYGEDSKAKSILTSSRNRARTAVNVFPHEAGFRPAVKNYREPIGKFPEYIIPEPLPAQKIVKKGEKQEGRERWKSNSFGGSRPTPSITLHPKNIISRMRR